jgi:hypothetical protein
MKSVTATLASFKTLLALLLRETQVEYGLMDVLR